MYQNKFNITPKNQEIMYIFVSILIISEMETKTKLTLKNTGKTTSFLPHLLN